MKASSSSAVCGSLGSLRATVIMFFLLVLVGCQTAADSHIDDAAEACPPGSDDSVCAADQEAGADRGFDPCLLNANLPVCKSE